jgi:hypothetical protein
MYVYIYIIYICICIFTHTHTHTHSDEQRFAVAATAAEWVRVTITASHGNRGASIADLQLLGYDATSTNLLVKQVHTEA